MSESKYIHIPFFFTLIIVFLLGGCSFNERFKAKPIYQEANAFFSDGDYKASLEKYEQIVEKYPSAADDALFQMSIIYAHPKNKQNDYDKSLECLHRLINDYQTSKHRHDANIMIFYIENAIIRDRIITKQQMKIDDLQQKVTTKQVEITTYKKQIETLEQNILALKMASIDKIIVEKKKRQLTLISRGEVIKAYKIALGGTRMGQKKGKATTKPRRGPTSSIPKAWTAVITCLSIFPIQTRETYSAQKNWVFLRAEI